jgi:hypothetical protein
MKKLLFALLVLSLQYGYGMERLSGWCEQGAKVVVAPASVGGAPISRSFQQSYPRCTVAVYITGTATLATLFQTNNPSPTGMTNPFQATSLGYWDFYAVNGHYDVQISGGGLAAPFTFGDNLLFDVFDYQPCPDCYLSAKGFITTAGLYDDYSSAVGGMFIRGVKISQNATGTQGGYIHLTPITYNPNNGPPVFDQYGNPVRDPVYLSGDTLGAHDAVLFVGESTDLIPNPDLVMGLFTNVYMFSKVGFATDFNSIASFQSLNGGMVAQSFAAVNYMNTGQHNGTPPPLTNLDQFHPGAIFYDTTAGCEKVYNGSTWSCLGSGGGGGGGTPAGANTQIQYNSSGVFGASTSFTWDNGLKLLNIVANSPSTAGLNVQVGFIQSAVGFVAVPASATTYNAVSALGGGVAARSMTATLYIQTGNNNGTPSVSGGDSFNAGAMYYDTGSNCEQVFNGSGWSCLAGGGATSPGGTNTNVQYNSSGTFAGSGNFTWSNGLQLLNVVAIANTAGMNVQNGFIQSAQGFVAVPASATTYNAVSALGGGMAANSFTASRYVQSGFNNGTPALSGGDSFNAGALYWDTGMGVERVFNGTAWISLSTGGNAAGANTTVQFNNAGVFAGSTNFTWNNGTQLLNIIAVNNAVPALNVQLGFIQADGGFVSGRSTYNTLNIVNGGLASHSVTATGYVQTGFNFSTPGSAGNALSLGDSLNPGTLFWNLTNGREEVYNGTSFVALGGGGSTTPGGVNTNVQFNSSGAFGGSSNFTWNGSLLNVVGTSNAAASINSQTGFIQSAGGFVTSQNTYNAAQAINGGMAAGSFTATNYVQAGSYSGSAPTLSSGDSFHAGALSWNSSIGQLAVFTGFGWSPVLSGTTSCPDGSLYFKVAQNFSCAGTSMQWIAGSTLLNLLGFPGTAVLNAQSGFIQSAGGFVTIQTTYNAVNAASGGMAAKNFTATGYMTPGISNTTPTFSGGDSVQFGTMFWNSGNNAFRMYVPQALGPSTPGYLDLISAGGAFIGKGVDVGSQGVSAGNYNVVGGFIGQTATLPGLACGSLHFNGGVFTGCF